MENLVILMKMIACLIGGIAVGNWFLTRVKRGHQRGDPWYKAYYSPPGLIILLAVFLLPLFLWYTQG